MQCPLLLPLLEHLLQPGLVLVEKAHHRLAHGRWQRRVVGGQHSAQAHALVLQHQRVQLRVAVQLLARVRALRVDALQGLAEAPGIAVDERLPQFSLARKVVVQAGLGHAQLARHVGVAEAVEAAGLDQSLGHVQDARRGACRLQPVPHAANPRSKTAH